MSQAVLEPPVEITAPRFKIGKSVRIYLALWCAEEVYSDPKTIVDTVKTTSGYVYALRGSSKFYPENRLQSVD